MPWLTGCGFSPLYASNDNQRDTRDVMPHIRFATPPGREGDQLQAELEDQFYLNRRPATPLYELRTTLDINAEPFLIDPDGISSRFDLILRSTYELIRLRTGEIFKRGQLSHKVSYNVSEQEDYATYISALDARREGIRALAQDYRIRLSAIIAHELKQQ